MSALVQSTLCGSIGASWTIAGPNIDVTATGNFGSTTTSGNLLVLHAAYQQGRLTGTGLPPTTIATPTTAGVTWAAILNGGWSAGTARNNEFIWIAGNAPSVSSGTTTTIHFTISAAVGTSSGGGFAEFSLYEFSGIVHSSSTGVGGPLIDKDAGLPNQTGGAPATANLATTVPDLVIASFTGNSANDTAGAGYTLGQTFTVATTTQFQYKTGVAAGSVATGFTGAQGNWGAISIAFKELAATGRNRAYFFG